MNQHHFADILCNQAFSQRHTQRRATLRYIPAACLALPAGEVCQAHIYDKSQ